MSRCSLQKPLLQIQTPNGEGKSVGAALLLRRPCDGEGIRIHVEMSLDKKVMAKVEVQLLASDRLYLKRRVRFLVAVDDPHGLEISWLEAEVRKPGSFKRLEIDADAGQILPGK